MTTDLRALIAQCETAKETGQWARLWLAVTPEQIKELARDAARFRWLLDSGDYYGTRITIHWTGEGRNIRAAIDADMGDET